MFTRTKMKKLLVIVSMVLSGMTSNAATQCKSIVEVAANEPGLTTLVTALTAAGLLDSLNAPGPITVFAPINSAFAHIPSSALNDLLKPENRLKLRSILLAHLVIGSELTSDWLKKNYGDSGRVRVANGGTQAAGLNDSGYTFGGANYITTDIQACNGIIHLIDTVLTPN